MVGANIKYVFKPSLRQSMPLNGPEKWPGGSNYTIKSFLLKSMPFRFNPMPIFSFIAAECHQSP
jgi:hypothetical protein